jgi:multiple antibiotic resistance protein
MHQAINAFLLGLPALFSIVNPLAGAFIFRQLTTHLPVEQRSATARTVAIYSLLVMIGALWAGSFILAFFGVSLAALRVAGGVVVALTAWTLLNQPEQHEANRSHQIDAASGGDDIALFPLTIPITAGPGTIAVAVTLSASRPKTLDGFAGFFVGRTTAAVAVAMVIWAAYAWTERIGRLMGRAGNRIITRLTAFLLLCIGVQIMITGVVDVLEPLFKPH